MLEADAAVLVVAQSHRHRSHHPPPSRRARQRAAGSMRERKGELGRLSIPSPLWLIIIAIAAREGEQDPTPTCLPTGSITAPFPTVGSATAALLTAAERLPTVGPVAATPPAHHGRIHPSRGQSVVDPGEAHLAVVKGEEERRWESATATSRING